MSFYEYDLGYDQGYENEFQPASSNSIHFSSEPQAPEVVYHCDPIPIPTSHQGSMGTRIQFCREQDPDLIVLGNECMTLEEARTRQDEAQGTIDQALTPQPQQPPSDDPIAQVQQAEQQPQPPQPPQPAQPPQPGQPPQPEQPPQPGGDEPQRRASRRLRREVEQPIPSRPFEAPEGTPQYGVHELRLREILSGLQVGEEEIGRFTQRFPQGPNRERQIEAFLSRIEEEGNGDFHQGMNRWMLSQFVQHYRQQGLNPQQVYDILSGPGVELIDPMNTPRPTTTDWSQVDTDQWHLLPYLEDSQEHGARVQRRFSFFNREIGRDSEEGSASVGEAIDPELLERVPEERRGDFERYYQQGLDIFDEASGTTGSAPRRETPSAGTSDTGVSAEEVPEAPQSYQVVPALPQGTPVEIIPPAQSTEDPEMRQALLDEQARMARLGFSPEESNAYQSLFPERSLEVVRGSFPEARQLDPDEAEAVGAPIRERVRTEMRQRMEEEATTRLRQLDPSLSEGNARAMAGQLYRDAVPSEARDAAGHIDLPAMMTARPRVLGILRDLEGNRSGMAVLRQRTADSEQRLLFHQAGELELPREQADWFNPRTESGRAHLRAFIFHQGNGEEILRDPERIAALYRDPEALRQGLSQFYSSGDRDSEVRRYQSATQTAEDLIAQLRPGQRAQARLEQQQRVEDREDGQAAQRESQIRELRAQFAREYAMARLNHDLTIEQQRQQGLLGYVSQGMLGDRQGVMQTLGNGVSQGAQQMSEMNRQGAQQAQQWVTIILGRQNPTMA